MIEFKNNGKIKLLVVAGPTAVGKSHLAIRLAKELDGEVISADSMQVYRNMNIGTAKITKDEMQGIAHHLIDIKNPDEDYDIVAFQKDAKKVIKDISNRGKLPIICGGTGFYIQAITKDINFSVDIQNDEYKKDLLEILDKNGKEKGSIILHNILKKVDPEYALEIHRNNIRRVINALCYYNNNGEKLSEHNKREFMKESPYDLIFLVLNGDREIIYNKINKRVNLMIKEGLVKEVENLRNMGYDALLKPMQGLDYKEINEYLDDKCSLDDAIENMKIHTRQFAKRQITWFKREKDAIWVDYQDIDKINIK